MRELSKLSKVYNFKIIEDASHALGSLYRNTKIGSCIYSDLTIFSFHPVKMITTAEGGMVTTRKKDLYNKLKVYREHGLIRDIKKFKFSNKVSTYYEQQELGYNYRMSDLNAALGISQLKRLSSFLKKRNQIKNFYTKELKNFPVKFQEIDKKNFCSFHLIVILVSKKIRNKLFKHFRSNCIFVNIHYIPIFFHPFHRKKKYFKNLNSIDYYDSAISLPVYFDLKKRQMKDVVKVIKNFFKFNI